MTASINKNVNAIGVRENTMVRMPAIVERRGPDCVFIAVKR
jgi:hypothetical protein